MLVFSHIFEHKFSVNFSKSVQVKRRRQCEQQYRVCKYSLINTCDQGLPGALNLEKFIYFFRIFKIDKKKVLVKIFFLIFSLVRMFCLFDNGP